MINLAGKTAVVFGLANKRSIAWGIAQKLHEAGATLAICYQNERMKAEAEDLINELGDASGFQCDVSNDIEIATLFASSCFATAGKSLPPARPRCVAWMARIACSPSSSFSVIRS